jgi:prepilin-type N-terminal cleavage/methylation domain-containing protein
MRVKALSLLEVMIVVAILGILGAIVLPYVKGHVEKAREAAAKENLKILRETITRYAVDHNDVPPGYSGDDLSGQVADGAIFALQLTGQDYLPGIPENPFNGLSQVKAYSRFEDLPQQATGDYGWLYQAESQSIRLDWPGADSEGVRYYDY